jgi:hypothetical protein
MWVSAVRLVTTASIPSSVYDEHSLRWSSVSAVRPATAQTFTLKGGTHDGMQSSTGGTASGTPVYVSNVATPWLWTWAALLLLLPHPTHARARRRRETRDDREG